MQQQAGAGVVTADAHLIAYLVDQPQPARRHHLIVYTVTVEMPIR
jgi:hypothetical protein